MNTVFNGSALRLARIFNEMTIEDVASRVGKTRQYLHKLEIGQTAPTKDLHDQIAEALRVMPEFFYSNEAITISEDQYHFRKMFTTRAMIKQVTMARGELIRRLVEYIDRELKLPDLNIPEVDGVVAQHDIERAAELCRHEWGIGLGPITNMTRLAENIGLVVTSFSSISKEIDALSMSVRRPIIVRNDAKESACRQRFDIGHEMGHLVLHKGIATGDRLTESQANRFASALLIPRSMMAKFFPKMRGTRINWDGLRDFKLTWKISKAAILYRANQLGLINDDQYRTGVITLRRGGEAIREREDYLIPVELPEMLKRSIDILFERKEISINEISAAIQVTPAFLKDLLGFDIPITSDSEMRKHALHLVRG